MWGWVTACVASPNSLRSLVVLVQVFGPEPTCSETRIRLVESFPAGGNGSGLWGALLCTTTRSRSVFPSCWEHGLLCICTWNTLYIYINIHVLGWADLWWNKTTFFNQMLACDFIYLQGDDAAFDKPNKTRAHVVAMSSLCVSRLSRVQPWWLMLYTNIN